MDPDLAVGAVVLLDAIAERGPRVLLVQRRRPPMQGTWTLPGGRVERGERLTDALRREVREETGLEVEVGALVEIVELIDAAGGFHFVILDYIAKPLATLRSLEPRAGDDAADARWVELGDLAQYAVTEAVRRVIEQAMETERR